MKKMLLLLLLLMFPSSVPAEEPAFVLRHGDRESPRIAITVDDCYDGKHIEAIVDLCREHGVVVTFFPIGNALKYADTPIWQDAVALGCEIGNHTWGHKTMTSLNSQQVRHAMLRTQQKVDELLGYHYPMQLMRPPGGTVNRSLNDDLQAMGYRHAVLWDVSQTDPKKALRATKNGSILLYHGRQKDVNCLKKLIPALLEKGFEPVTVSELLGLEAVATSTDLYVYE